MKKQLFTYITIFVITSLLACVGEGSLKGQFNRAAADRGDGWSIAAPEDEGVIDENIEKAYRQLFSEHKYPTAISMLVVRNGKLIAEGYTRDREDHYVYEAVQSVTKSMTSLVFGAIQADGYFPDLDQALYDFIPDVFDDNPDKRKITLRHLLTMRSGIKFDNDDFALEMIVDNPSRQTAYILKKSLYAQPGEKFYYRDCDPQLLSDAVLANTGKTLEQWAQEKIFTPLQISDYKWLQNSNGNSFGPFGLYLHPRDLAKIGQLVLQKGQWNSQQLVPESWINASTGHQTDINKDRDTEGFSYGFYWWIVPELNAFTAWGHGGNFIFVIPDKNMLIVFTAEPDAGDEAGTTLKEFIPLVQIIIQDIS